MLMSQGPRRSPYSKDGLRKKRETRARNNCLHNCSSISVIVAKRIGAARKWAGCWTYRNPVDYWLIGKETVVWTFVLFVVCWLSFFFFAFVIVRYLLMVASVFASVRSMIWHSLVRGPANCIHVYVYACLNVYMYSLFHLCILMLLIYFFMYMYVCMCTFLSYYINMYLFVHVFIYFLMYLIM